MKEDLVKKLYLKLFKHLCLTPEEFHYDLFELRDGQLYYKDMTKSLTKIGGDLRMVKDLADILGKKRLNKLSFSIPRGKLTARQAVMLNIAEKELPSESDITKADDKELQEIM